MTTDSPLWNQISVLMVLVFSIYAIIKWWRDN
jgi:uncharacterized membrane protein YdbT with pleckstrin-like domain